MAGKVKVKVRLVRSVILDGEVAPKGKVVSVDPAVAAMMLNAGQAEPVKASGRKTATAPEGKKE